VLLFVNTYLLQTTEYRKRAHIRTPCTTRERVEKEGKEKIKGEVKTILLEIRRAIV
jgi:hypothetical protein